MEQKKTACVHAELCGGCFYQKESEQEELDQKEKLVFGLLQESCPEGFAFEGILQSPYTEGYRNKMEFSFGDDRKDGPLTLGLHQKKSFYNVINIEHCRIVHEDFNRITRAAVSYFRELGLPYFSKRSHIGYLRHLIIRRAAFTGELLIDLVTSGQNPDREDEILKNFAELLLQLQRAGELEGTIRGILHTKNDSLSDAVRDDGTEILYGTGYIDEELLGLRFRITPFSFFQTNSHSAELLYSRAREYISAALSPDKVVYDLYSGTGTIAQILAPAAKKVVGIEIVSEAVEAARLNAERNALSNCEFLCGDVFEQLDSIREKPDVIVLDPPREGVNPKALRKIIAYGVEQILYISCKPESLARDLTAFRVSGYRLVKAVCINQFPRTKHVETVVLLCKK